jgi:hypothetical protein
MKRRSFQRYTAGRRETYRGPVKEEEDCPRYKDTLFGWERRGRRSIEFAQQRNQIKRYAPASEKKWPKLLNHHEKF